MSDLDYIFNVEPTRPPRTLYWRPSPRDTAWRRNMRKLMDLLDGISNHMNPGQQMMLEQKTSSVQDDK